MGPDDLETRSFPRLYEEYGGLVFATTIQILRDRHLAEDAVQETWVRVARALDRGVEPQHRTSWLLTIARREALRIAGRRPTVMPPTEREAHTDLHEAEERESREAVSAALSDLSTEDRDLLVLRYLEGLPPRVLTDRLGLTRSGLWKRLRSAGEKFAHAFRRRG